VNRFCLGHSLIQLAERHDSVDAAVIGGEEKDVHFELDAVGEGDSQVGQQRHLQVDNDVFQLFASDMITLCILL
jgi:hypothetical protein